VLQTLLHLHQQEIVLPSGQRQFGLVHGNLSLDSLLWVEYGPRQWFVYLTDLALWERLFDPPTAELFNFTVTPATVERDLIALGEMGYTLLTGRSVPAPDRPLAEWAWPEEDPYLTAYQTLAPYATALQPITDLFPELSEGSGFSLELQSTEDVVGRWITFNRAMVSPAQGTAAARDVFSSEESESLGRMLQFGPMPPAPDLIASLVLINVGNAAAPVTLFSYDVEGGLVATHEIVLEPMVPFARVIDDLVPDAQPVSVIAYSKEALLTGATFTFNADREPSIGSAQRIVHISLGDGRE
jgi:hypothetical protein